MVVLVLGACVGAAMLGAIVAHQPRPANDAPWFVVTPPPAPAPVQPKTAPHTAPITCIPLNADFKRLESNTAGVCYPDGACETLAGGDNGDVTPPEMPATSRVPHPPPQIKSGFEREGELVGSIALANTNLFVRVWDADQIPPPPSLPYRATFTDKRGHVLDTVAIGHDFAEDIYNLGQDSYLVFDDNGSMKIVTHGRVESWADLGAWREHDGRKGDPATSRIDGIEQHINVIRFPDEAPSDVTEIEGDNNGSQYISHFGLEWCDASEDVCRAATLSIGSHTTKSKKLQHWMDLQDRRSFALCP
ncbi:MAG: hypothetical protein QM831_13230 [Kofleriaceae bacterium]